MFAACPACTSPHRAEIESRLRAKESVRSISAWLLADKKETITKSTLASAFAAKVLSLPRVALALAPEPEQEGLPSETALPPLEALAAVQNKALKIVEALEKHMESAGVTASQVTLFNGVMKELRQAAKNRHELVNGRKYVLNGEVIVKTELKEASTDDLKKKRDELRLKSGGNNG
jgi:nucleotide-binding universal stress UspA family protein